MITHPQGGHVSLRQLDCFITHPSFKITKTNISHWGHSIENRLGGFGKLDKNRSFVIDKKKLSRLHIFTGMQHEVFTGVPHVGVFTGMQHVHIFTGMQHVEVFTGRQHVHIFTDMQHVDVFTGRQQATHMYKLTQLHCVLPYAFLSIFFCYDQ